MKQRIKASAIYNYAPHNLFINNLTAIPKKQKDCYVVLPISDTIKKANNENNWIDFIKKIDFENSNNKKEKHEKDSFVYYNKTTGLSVSPSEVWSSVTVQNYIKKLQTEIKNQKEQTEKNISEKILKVVESEFIFQFLLESIIPQYDSEKFLSDIKSSDKINIILKDTYNNTEQKDKNGKYDKIFQNIYRDLKAPKPTPYIKKIFCSSAFVLEKLSIGIRKFITSRDVELVELYLNAIDESKKGEIRKVIKILLDLSMRIDKRIKADTNIAFQLKRRNLTVSEKLFDNIRLWIEHFAFTFGILNEDNLKDSNTAILKVIHRNTIKSPSIPNERYIHTRIFPVLLRLLDSDFSLLNTYYSEEETNRKTEGNNNELKHGLNYIQESIKTILTMHEVIDSKNRNNTILHGLEETIKHELKKKIFPYSKLILVKILCFLYTVSKEIENKLNKAEIASLLGFEHNIKYEKEYLIDKIYRDI